MRLGRGRGRAAAARDLTRRALRGGVAGPDAVEDVLLVVSELVTNVLDHTSCDPLLVVCFRAGRVRVEVRDADPRLPVPQHPSPAAPHGRGLALVAAVSVHHGVRRLPGAGKAVWALLALRPTPREP
ncbi:hypothetical protein GCM10010302_43450 [Streptomyces polychromogenes]|uniref:Histidine kinase/HSP90-like ATPase domain-containing protein n=1 Tax=Streptomyces polychromogenes TaxID=67342 RepID=A0ABN0VHC1_9ACTN